MKLKEKSVKEVKPREYKGYDIEWLRKETDHPDFKLVAEYDAKFK